jgi:kynurenine formamidase
MADNRIYLSYFMNDHTPLYGGGKGIHVLPDRSILAGDTANTKTLKFQNHSGTHIDFPNHFFNLGCTSEKYAADFWMFANPHLIIRSTDDNEIVNFTDEELSTIPEDVDFLIFKSGFGDHRLKERYWLNNPGFSPELGKVLKSRFPLLKILGMDFISLTSYQNREIGREAHREFLGGDKPILLVEDMDLSLLFTTPKSLNCLPLLIEGLDGSPVTIIAEI